MIPARVVLPLVTLAVTGGILSAHPPIRAPKSKPARASKPTRAPKPATRLVVSNTPRFFVPHTRVGFWRGYHYFPRYSAPPFQFDPPGSPVYAPPLRGAGGGVVSAPPPAGAVAWLTVEFPAEAQVRVDGERIPDRGRALTLTSPALPLRVMHTFRVKARWEVDGRPFEWERAVDVLAGEQSQVVVARGFPVTGPITE